MKSTPFEVIVVGAGPTGLFLACELALAGVSTLVLERDVQKKNQYGRMNLVFGVFIFRRAKPSTDEASWSALQAPPSGLW